MTGCSKTDSMSNFDDGIRLAEAMGWEKHPSEEWWSAPGIGMFKTVEFLPDPFTDANDDYQVLEWMRDRLAKGDKEEWFLFCEGLTVPCNYLIGDYARAALMAKQDEELEQAIIDMECSCLPYASETGEGVCQRCEALSGEQAINR